MFPVQGDESLNMYAQSYKEPPPDFRNMILFARIHTVIRAKIFKGRICCYGWITLQMVCYKHKVQTALSAECGDVRRLLIDTAAPAETGMNMGITIVWTQSIQIRVKSVTAEVCQIKHRYSVFDYGNTERILSFAFCCNCKLKRTVIFEIAAVFTQLAVFLDLAIRKLSAVGNIVQFKFRFRLAPEVAGNIKKSANYRCTHTGFQYSRINGNFFIKHLIAPCSFPHRNIKIFSTQNRGILSVHRRRISTIHTKSAERENR